MFQGGQGKLKKLEYYVKQEKAWFHLTGFEVLCFQSGYLANLCNSLCPEQAVHIVLLTLDTLELLMTFATVSPL